MPRPSPSLQKRTGLVCMVGHTRRFNPSHQWIHRRIAAGEMNVQQMDVQTYFFRRTQHERARAAALLDGSPAVASRRAHRGPVPLPGAFGDRARQRRAGADPPGRSASRWTCRSSCRRPAAPSARCRCRSTTTGRWARSSATSATTAPTSRATTSSSTARTTPSTCRRWTSRSTASSCRTASSFAAIRERSRTELERGAGAAVLPHPRTNWRQQLMPLTQPPFRADHVGSLLRPPELTRARAEHKAGPHRCRRRCARPKTMRFATS